MFVDVVCADVQVAEMDSYNDNKLDSYWYLHMEQQTTSRNCSVEPPVSVSR